jgi:L-ribulose-5-phosphate 3-epimerase
MQIGILLPLTPTVEIEFEKASELGMRSCQVVSWQPDLFTPELAARTLQASQRNNIAISSFWCGWEGPKVWDFVSGPLTLGLVPPAYRFQRLQNLFKGADFAALLGVQNLITHVGYIPENASDPEYPGLIAALRYLAGYCQQKGLHFLFETGQETPVTLLRAIEDIGLDNLGVNLDPANLILYGKANPVDALDVIGRYVRDVHAKDGLYPTNGRHLGIETPLGRGKVDFTALLRGLKALGYTGPLTIEREITGDQQIRDIRAGKEMLEKILAKL